MLVRRLYANSFRFIVGTVALITMFQAGPGALAQTPGHAHGKRTGLAVELEYACGNTFVITNPNTAPVKVTYRVTDTTEEGSVRVAGAPPEDPGFTEKLFETRKRGTVELYVGDKRVSSQPNDQLPCVPDVAALAVAAEPAISGSWTAPLPWPVVAIHLHLLPDGRVLSWGRTGYPQIWDPKTGQFTSVPSPVNLFCAGHAFLPNGRLLVVGGHISDFYGLAATTLFDTGLGTWVRSATMPRGRWYPTATTMANGAVVITAGTDESAANVPVPEVWTAGKLRSLTGASLALPYYPRTFLAPNGKLFYAGTLRSTKYLDVTGTGSWTPVANRIVAGRTFGTAVMYEPGKILYAGGGRSTNTAEVIDLNQPVPAWKATGSMEFARHHHNLVLLPNGEALATDGVGGTSGNDLTKAVFAAEVWSPLTEKWTTLASSIVPRGYHGTALLLPDGRVLQAGSGEGSGGTPERNFEIFSPPYLFAGARPTIDSAPAVTSYGQTLRVITPDASAIDKVSFIRLGSVTHAFDMNQRYQTLSFTADATGLTVTGPNNRNVTPPGHYMLFILNASGVPSEAKIVQVK